LKCKDIIKELSSYLNGETDTTLMSDLERHLGHCEDCRLVVDTTRKTIHLFCNSQPAPLPEDVRGRLHKALESRLRRHS
jgi:predicted anti-sigma-YlaC factor YlaD